MSVEVGGVRIPVSVIVPAAGSGKRMGGGTVKQFLPLRGEPVLVHTVRLLTDCPLVDEVIVVASDVAVAGSLVSRFPKVSQVIPGGAERQDSVWAGLQAVQTRPRIVAIHDAARPLLPADVLEGVLRKAAVHSAQVVAVPVHDTVKRVSQGGVVMETLDRSELWAVQTPQVFWVEILVQAFRAAQSSGFVGTDDASLVERLGVPVHIYPGSPENIKLTAPADLRVAEAILEGRL